MNKQKDNLSLNTEAYIDKGADTLADRRKDFTDDSRMGKAFVSTASGMGDIKKGIENLQNLNQDTAYLKKDGTPLPSNELADLKTQISYLKDDIAESQYQAPQQKIETKKVQK